MPDQDPQHRGPYAEPALLAPEVHRDDGVTVSLHGDLDGRSSSEFVRQIEGLLDLDPRSITLNLSRLRSIDDPGLAALSSIRVDAEGAGVPIRLDEIPEVLGNRPEIAHALSRFAPVS